ncbi:MAG TPA: response regulator transcription factor, partial [Spirochaetota bacterium]|nr:response regulator transcription factor [Spirochaetota bacterium]
MKTAETARTAKRILIVDDHPLICRGLAQVIDQEGDLRVCGDAGDINDAMKKIESLAPDLVVVDISLKSSSGIDLIKAVRA